MSEGVFGNLEIIDIETDSLIGDVAKARNDFGAI
jgi:hypothetical protein